MPKFLLEANYTADGAKGLIKDGGTGRRSKVEAMIKQLNGKLEAFYYGFGSPDVFVIADLPDAKAAAAVSMAVNQSGTVTLKTHVLMTPEEIDQAAKIPVSYQAPGR
jgi:uncharacterized protein with GYD domain